MADDQRFFFLDLTKNGVPRGGSQKLNHLNWIELNDWSFDMHQTVEPNVGAGTPDKTAAAGTFAFTIVHNGPSIFKLATSGKFLSAPVTFEAERSGLQAAGAQATSIVYLQLVFNNVVVSSRAINGDDGRKTEHITLAFEQVTISYWPIVNGVRGPIAAKSYNVKSNQVS